jgi:hypothetical protein
MLIEQPALPATSAVRAELAGLMVHAMRRYAAGAAPANAVETEVKRQLDQITDARRTTQELARRVDRLPTARRKSLLSPRFADLGADRPVMQAEVRGLVDRLRPTTLNPGGPVTSSPRFELTFSHVICRDESNPEALGSDEPYGVFGVLSEADALASRPPRVVKTPTYENVDDGDRRPSSGSQNLQLFGPGRITSDLIVTAVWMEQDLGADGVKVVNAIKVGLGIAAAIAKATGAALVAAVLGAGQTVAGLIESLGADDQVGAQITIALSEAEAVALTRSSARVELPRLRFNGGDSNGIYDAFLALRRS